jgi:uncharacterized protein YihD (DUF1040 family)
MGTGDGPVGSNSGRIGEIAPSRSRGTFQQDDMSAVGEIEAKTGVLGEDNAGGTPERITGAQDNQIDWHTKTAEFKAKIADYQKDRRLQMEEFWNKYVKAAKKGKPIQEPDPEILNNDLERWRVNSKKKDSRLLKSLSSYTNHEDLHDDVLDYRTKSEEKEEQERLASLGAKLVYQDEGGYKTYLVKTPEALANFAQQGTHWCTKNINTARNKLSDWTYHVITRDDQPIFAIKTPPDANNTITLRTPYDTDDEDEYYDEYEGFDDEILYRTDFNVRSGDGYMIAANETEQPLYQDDYKNLNDVLTRLHRPKLDYDFIRLVKDEKEAATHIKQALDDEDMERLELMLASFGTRGLPPEIMNQIAEDPNALEAYIASQKGRLRDLEDKIIKSPDLILAYSQQLNSRFPKNHRDQAEKELINNATPKQLLNYAKTYNGRFEAAEERLTEEWDAILGYSKMLGTRFPEPHQKEAENWIFSDDPLNDNRADDVVEYFIKNKDSFSNEEQQRLKEEFSKHSLSALAYARATKQRFKEGEAAIAQNSGTVMPYMYVLDLNEFPEEHRATAEEAVITDPATATEYALWTNKRFEAGEPTIAQDPHHAIRYAREFQMPRFEAAEGAIIAAPEHTEYLRKYVMQVLKDRFVRGEKELIFPNTKLNTHRTLQYFTTLNNAESYVNFDALEQDILASKLPEVAWAYVTVRPQAMEKMRPLLAQLNNLDNDQDEAIKNIIKKDLKNVIEYTKITGKRIDNDHPSIRRTSSRALIKEYEKTLKQLGLFDQTKDTWAPNNE